MSTSENTPQPDTTPPESESTQPAPDVVDPALDDAMRSIRGVGENLRGED
ncbi:hypothetical protein [Subtercola boreus]|nr:hypothetical protein [Subtercola boreus]